MRDIAQPFNRPFNRLYPRSVLLSLYVLIEQELLLLALVIGLTGLRGIWWILAEYPCPLAAAVLIHRRRTRAI